MQLVCQLFSVGKITVVEGVKTKGREPIVKKELTTKKEGTKPQPKDLKSLVTKYFPDCPDLAWQVVLKESGANPNAINTKNINGTIDRGLFQINSVHLWRVNNDYNSLLDPETNIKIARDIYKEQGWCPWVAAKKLGLCR